MCPFQHDFESFWLCGAVEPASGTSFVLELPALNADNLQIFLDEFAAAHAQDPAHIHVLLLDNGGAHHAKKLRWPARVVPLFLPAYCPELNPIERWWRELKDAVANTLFGSLDALRKLLDAQLHTWRDAPARLASLTSYPYLCCALEMLDQPR